MLIIGTALLNRSMVNSYMPNGSGISLRTADTLTPGDTMVKELDMQRNLSDSISCSEGITQAVTITPTETVSLTDWVQRQTPAANSKFTGS